MLPSAVEAAASASADAAQQGQGQERGEQGAGQQGPAWRGEDPYDPGEPDPARSRALESSLWELEALRCHAVPAVASLAAAVMDKDLGDRKKTTEVGRARRGERAVRQLGTAALLLEALGHLPPPPPRSSAAGHLAAGGRQLRIAVRCRGGATA